jgi:diguanylate cyclase (GGDEF)-like protein/PAS domain S-box-containing protein
MKNVPIPKIISTHKEKPNEGKLLRVLLVEGSEKDARPILRRIKNDGYNLVYERVKTAFLMKKALKEKQWDIILCNYKLLNFSASSAITVLKKANVDVPLIVIAGTIGEATAVKCMRLGAKDYIMKHNMSRLCPAIAREIEEAKVRNKKKQIEEKLRDKEKRFRAFVEHSSDIIVILNPEGIITYINPAVEKVLGFKPEERIGANGFELVHPDDIKVLTGAFNTLSKDKNAPIIQGELHLRHKDGSWRTLEAVGSNQVNNNVVEYIIINYRDITERKRAEESLRETELKFRTIFDFASDGILLAHIRDGKFSTANKRMCEMLGYTKNELLKLSVSDIHPDESLPYVTDQFEKLVKEEIYIAYNTPVKKKDGTVFFADVNSSPITLDGKKCLLGMFRDITKRKQVEDILRESEGKYRELVKYAPAGIYEVDHETGHFKSVNDIVCEYTGYTREELLNMNLNNLLTEESQKCMAERIEKILAGEKVPQSVEYRIRTKNGEILWVIVNPRHIYEEGKLKGVTGIIYNITDRKLAEEALRKSEQKYLELSTIDGLTQLYNSRHFYDQLKKEIDRSNRYGQPLTLLLLDIDKFKNFNDAYGHIEGDHVLSRLGHVISRCLRETDSAYRYGGEEFTVMLPTTTIGEGIVTAKRIQTELTKEAFSPMLDQNVNITVSIGISQYRLKEEMKSFVHRADQLMYQAKQNGRHRICDEL